MTRILGKHGTTNIAYVPRMQIQTKLDIWRLLHVNYINIDADITYIVHITFEADGI